MKDEIKEILNEIGYHQHIHEQLTLNPKELDILVGFIINLQEGNKRLEKIVENLTTMTVCGDKKQIKNTAQYKLEKAQSKIDKANEVISSILYSYDERMYEYCDVNYIEELRELKKELGGDG